jgi:hypothetical protein
MRIKSQQDFWAGLMFIALGVVFAWGATEYSFGSAARPGPGYFPFGLGILLALLGALVLLSALTLETEDGGRVGRIAWRPLLIIVGAVVLFAFMLPRLGMIVSLPVLIFVAALAGDEFHWGEALVIGAVLTVASWGIFIYGLGLTIPVWPKFIVG